jgi:hypothetical protein
MKTLTLLLLAIASAAPAAAQDEALTARVMTAVRAAMAPALPFPASDEEGSLPAGGNTTALWMVRPLQPGDRAIEVIANPLNEVNQARATRAMAQIRSAIESAQRRAQAQYDRAVAEAKRTGRSQDVDGVTLSDEGIAGARIDAESHVTVEVAFNQTLYRFQAASSVEPAPSRQVSIPGAAAVIGAPSNVCRGDADEERYCEAESQVYLGRVSVPAVERRGDSRYEVTAGATASGNGPAVASMVVRVRGNDALIADILRQTDWNSLMELMK